MVDQIFSLLPSYCRVSFNPIIQSIKMKVSKLDERIHVLDDSSNVLSVIRDITSSGIQEEAFYVLDVGDILHKHQIWKEKLPRVDPYYGTHIFFYTTSRVSEVSSFPFSFILVSLFPTMFSVTSRYESFLMTSHVTMSPERRDSRLRNLVKNRSHFRIVIGPNDEVHQLILLRKNSRELHILVYVTSLLQIMIKLLIPHLDFSWSLSCL